jgi:hypothetical protein
MEIFLIAFLISKNGLMKTVIMMLSINVTIFLLHRHKTISESYLLFTILESGKVKSSVLHKEIDNLFKLVYHNSYKRLR